jgi:hypothetical protein
MFKPFYGRCVQCKKDDQLICVSKGFCQRCNHENKQAKKKALGKKTDGYKFVKKATGEKELFEDIATEREWVDFVTGEPLRQLTPTQFLHVLPKALNKYPLFKLYKKNIVLGSDETHFKWDNAPRSELRKDPQFDKLFALEEELIEEYKVWKARR